MGVRNRPVLQCLRLSGRRDVDHKELVALKKYRVALVEEVLVSLLLAYVENGVESVRKGCVIVVGSRELLRAHPPLFTSDFEERNEQYSLLDNRQSHSSDAALHRDAAVQSIRRRLNDDGMVLVDGASGVLIATNLYSRRISDNAPWHGSRTKSVLGLSESGACHVILQVSQDGYFWRIEDGVRTEIIDVRRIRGVGGQ
eukprot:GEMP01033817.1.p1 GENE.GEMP01033817.1~~GEMP01033817.1.p1  ORF type:complete len:199 (+),score=29.23 GEMP01033817.1:1147-1743(+)